jgi:endo-1,4-beta-xylanase
MLRVSLSILAVLLLSRLADAAEPLVVPLWDKGAPGFENRKGEKEIRQVQKSGEYKVTNIHNPSLTVFLPSPAKNTGTAVILAPGGGHRELWVMHEGENVARWLNERGIAAFVLRYRLGREKGSPYKIAEHALQDGQRAVRLVRAHAREWGVDPARVGMMGFSAGGEVVAMVAGHADAGSKEAADPVDRESSRLAFQALIYSGPLGIVREKATSDMPPAFILVGDEDNAAKVLVEHYQALRKAKVSAELHVYAKTPHGFGYRPQKTARPVDIWLERFVGFLSAEGILKKG